MMAMKGLYVVRVPFGQIFIAVYLLEGRTLGLVDSGFLTSPEELIIPYVKQIGREPREITMVALTHWHGDHVDGSRWLKKLYGSKVATHEQSVRGVEEPGLEWVEAYGEVLTREERENAVRAKPQVPLKVDVPLREGDTVQLGDRILSILYTPGHVRGSICLYDEENRLLFTGDSVQSWGPNPDGGPFYSDLDAYRASIKRLIGLNPKIVLPAHPYRPFRDCILEGKDAEVFLSESLLATDRIDEVVYQTLRDSAGPIGLGAVTDAVAAALGFTAEGPTVSGDGFTTRTTVNAHLKALRAEGKAESLQVGERIAWKIAG
ncbi:MAG: MBL fold metallo-hydrolase [Candidatus Bathyarchaeia archaeon]